MQRIVANDVKEISKYLFVQFVGDGCLVDKARNKPDSVWSTFNNSIKNNIRLFLNICEEALMTVQFTFHFNQFNHFAPSIYQQTPASSSDSCSRFCPSFYCGHRLTIFCFIHCYWSFNSCYIYLLLVQSRN